MISRVASQARAGGLAGQPLLKLPRLATLPPNMALQRTRRPSLRSGRSLRSLGSPLNAYPLAGRKT